MVVAARRLGARAELADHARELPRRLAHGALALLLRGQRGLAQHSGVAVGGRPGGHVAGPVAVQVGVEEVRFVAVVGDRAVGDQVLAHVILRQVQVHGGLQLAGVGDAARKAALAPARQELRVHRQELPPRTGQALGVGLQVHPARGQVQVGHVGAVAVEEDDLLEAVVGEAGADVDDALDEVLPVDAGGAGKVHHVRGVAMHERGHDQHLVRDQPRRRLGDPARAHHVHVQRQVRPVLLGRSHRADHHPLLLHRLVDLRPGQLLVAPRLRTCHRFLLLSVER